MSKKYVLEFDEMPSFLYVSFGSGQEEIYKNGESVQHWTALELETSVNDIPRHQIDYVDVGSKAGKDFKPKKTEIKEVEEDCDFEYISNYEIKPLAEKVQEYMENQKRRRNQFR